MTLEEYLRRKFSQQAAQIASEAPLDSCPDCNVCEGQLFFNEETSLFQYKCRCCGLQWSADHLVIDASGKFQFLELAD